MQSPGGVYTYEYRIASELGICVATDFRAKCVLSMLVFTNLNRFNIQMEKRETIIEMKFLLCFLV